MDLYELKNILDTYNNKLDKTLEINSMLLSKLHLDNSKRKMNFLLKYRYFEAACFAILAFLFGNFVGNNLHDISLIIGGFILNVFAIIGLGGSIYQIILMKDIDYSQPVIEIRKKIELINSHSLFITKLMFFTAPFWWVYVIVGLNILTDINIIKYLDHDFMISYLGINFLIIVPLLWLFRKINFRNIHIPWVKNTISFLTDKQTYKAIEFLNEIDEYKKEEIVLN